MFRFDRFCRGCARALIAGLGMLAACGSPQITVQNPFGVIDWVPQDGAIDVDPAADEGVCFNLQVNATDLGGVQLTIIDDSNTPISCLTVNNSQVNGMMDAYCLDLAHPTLNTSAQYQIVVPHGLTATDGETLATDLTSRFVTAAQ
jgi:hypothetical protein